MNWNELQRAWQGELLRLSPGRWNPADFAARRRRLARTLAVRDWTEAAAGAVVASGFACFLLFFRISDWRGWAAVLLTAMVSVAFVRERWRARRARPPVEAALLARLEAEIVELRHQRNLLRGILWWYLSPLGVAMLLFTWSLFAHIEAAGVTPDVTMLWFLGAATLGLGAAIWWLNRWTVRAWLEPLLEACERERAELAASSVD